MSADKEFVLADLAALTAEGPCFVFLRSKRALTEEEDRNVGSFCGHVSRALGGNVVFLNIPHDIEIMAVGEAEIRKLGWTKIDISLNDALDDVAKEESK